MSQFIVLIYTAKNQKRILIPVTFFRPAAGLPELSFPWQAAGLFLSVREPDPDNGRSCHRYPIAYLPHIGVFSCCTWFYMSKAVSVSISLLCAFRRIFQAKSRCSSGSSSSRSCPALSEAVRSVRADEQWAAMSCYHIPSQGAKILAASSSLRITASQLRVRVIVSINWAGGSYSSENRLHGEKSFWERKTSVWALYAIACLIKRAVRKPLNPALKYAMLIIEKGKPQKRPTLTRFITYIYTMSAVS